MHQCQKKVEHVRKKENTSAPHAHTFLPPLLSACDATSRYHSFHTQVHNLVVCTLCSCYPAKILGLSPQWYKSRVYRARAVRDPRAVLSEFGTEIASQVRVRVHDSTADCRYLVLPGERMQTRV
jgi:hypothetical protein